ncbi:MAG TPA: M20/M25/M40 family metallo-hydrolase [bacterium]|nr:M20/M25/M40 family metallo-hydrolase [bacterium]
MKALGHFLRSSLVLLLFLPSPTLAAEPLPTLDLLKKLIELDTSNPPGNEKIAAEFLRDYLASFGIASEILESAPGRANLVARLKGSGERKSLLMLGHLDVVPAEAKDWQSPPFTPTIREGYLYGRGALDMKSLVAMEVQTFVKIHREGKPLQGDLVLALTADEEAGAKFGAQFLIEQHWDKIAADYVLNEGSVGQDRKGKHLYPIQVAEKGVAWIRLKAQGSPGHGSMPSKDNAVAILLTAMERLTGKQPPIRKTEISAEFLRRLADHESFPTSFAMRHLFSPPLRWLAGTFFADMIASDKVLNAMLRDTLVPTVLKAGFKTNVIPSEAVGEIDARLLPGRSPEEFLAEVQNKIEDLSVEAELLSQSQPDASPFDTPFFAAFEQAIRQADHQALVLPFISPGATDSRFFREKGIVAYGLIPLLLKPEDLAGLHGKDERIPVDELKRGEKILNGVVSELLQ